MTRYPWLFIIPCIAIIVIVAVSLVRFHIRKLRRKKKNKVTLIAHTNYVRNLPEYKAAQKRYNLMLVILAVTFVVAVGSLSMVASRPISVTETKTEAENRDIMLCLDVSTSMSGNIKSLITYFKELVSKMNGERFGITVFNGTYVTLSPLSTDYTAVLELLNELYDKIGAFNMRDDLSKYTSSDIGFGTAGCISAFDKLEEAERARSVILATDNINENIETRITLTEAANYAKSNNIAIYAIGASRKDSNDSNGEILNDDETSFTYASKELYEASILTGGSYYSLGFGNSLSAENIVNQIQAQEAARYEGANNVVRTDTPKFIAIIAAIALCSYILVVWRLRL